MAKPKTKKFNGDINLKITPKRKNVTYIQTAPQGEFDYNFNVNLRKFRVTEYQNFAYKDGNDLVIRTYFYKGSNYLPKKNVYTTFKNYFNSDVLADFNYIKDDNIILYSFNKNTPVGSNALFGAVNETAGQDFILASSEDEAELSLTLGSDYGDYVYDVAGKDTYNFSYNYNTFDKWDNVWDFDGDDKYIASDNTNIHTYDSKGSDEYQITTSYATTVDTVGADTYTISSLSGSNEVFTTDIYGDDKYFVSNIDLYDGRYLTIYDYKGADKYNFENVTFDQHATSFNDEYISVVDNYGYDEYRFTNVKNLSVYDKTGKENYYLTNSANVAIRDKKGNDIYDINNSGGIIYDMKGNDTYKVSNLNKQAYQNLFIYDAKGKDKLILQGTSEFDVIFMSDFSIDADNHYKDANASLIVYDVENGGFVQISHYFKDKKSDGIYDKGSGKGKIEKIYAGDTKISGYIPSRVQLNAIRETVGAWIATNTAFGSVSDVLTNGSNEQIATLVEFFDDIR